MRLAGILLSMLEKGTFASSQELQVLWHRDAAPVKFLITYHRKYGRESHATVYDCIGKKEESLASRDKRQRSGETLPSGKSVIDGGIQVRVSAAHTGTLTLPLFSFSSITTSAIRPYSEHLSTWKKKHCELLTLLEAAINNQ